MKFNKHKFKTTALNSKTYFLLALLMIPIMGVLYLFEDSTQIDISQFLKYIEKNPDSYELVEMNQASGNLFFIVNNKHHSWFNNMEVSIRPLEFDLYKKELENKKVSINYKQSTLQRFKFRPFSFMMYIMIIFTAIGVTIWSLRELLLNKKNFTNSNKKSTYTPNEYTNHKEEVNNENIEVNLSFDDIAGIDEVKDQIQEIVDLYNDSSKIKEMGGKIPKGVLLNGPPGTGKTLLAKTVASVCNVNFIHASGSEFVEMYVGVGAQRIRSLFAKARSMSPCIVFIDEIDAIAGKRGLDNNSEREQALNQLLVEMDGFNPAEQIFVFGATNQIEKLDPAILRPGRFDRKIYVNLPDVVGREKILKVYINKVKVSKDIDINEIARCTSGFSGADLANLVNEAILFAARNNKTEATQIDFLWAKDKIMLGSERSIKLSELDKKQTAYHEIGHAILSLKLNIGKLINVSIIPRGQALGVTQLESNDIHSITKEQAIEQIAMLMGGRVAEKIFFQHYSTGASNDLQRAYSLSKQMIINWGMSDKIGPLGIESKEDFYFLSESTKSLIDAEIINFIKEAETLAIKIILENKDMVIKLSEALILKENLTMNEINFILNV